MNESTRILFEQLGVSLALGLLIGLQRQRTESLIAGVRTFPLIAVLGTLAATLDRRFEGGSWMTPAGLLGLVVVVAVSNFYQLRRENSDLGITTEAAILLMYLIGAYVVVGDRIVAVAVGAGVAVLLQFKPELHGIAARLGNEDLRAIMTFALITCVILPVLPNRTYSDVEPLNVVNPFQIWLMVVLMVGISLGGYLVYKFFGHNSGLLLCGLLGGAISSTATTVSFAKRTRLSPESSPLAALVILLASSVVFARVLLELSVVARPDFALLAPPVAVMMVISALAAVPLWLRMRGAPAQLPQQENPTELKSALLFAALYIAVLMALSLAKQYLGGHSLYAVAILSGLTDMDAITLSTGRLVQMGTASGGIAPALGWRLIVVASIANLFFKWMLCATISGSPLAWRIGAVFALPAVAGGIMLWVLP